jgi:2-oxoglutarate dehydrogenase E2 component (dihydrolipoamide succinyltransferase)
MSDLVVPALGESISEAIIAKWLKKVGDAVAIDEPVVDLETDKVSVQLPAPAAGVLAEQSAAEGATVKVGQTIGKIKDGAGAQASAAASTPAAPKAEGDGKPGAVATTTTSPPAQAVTTTTVTAASTSSPPTAPAPPSTPPTPTTAAAPPAAGVVAARESDSNIPATAIATTAAESHGGGDAGHDLDPNHVLSPARRRALREREGIAVSAMTVQSVPVGTPAGITLPVTFPSAPAPAPTPAPTVVGPQEEVLPMSPLRKRIAERLVAAQHTAAILTTFNEVDMTNLLELRAQNQDAFVAKHGIKVGFMSFFTKAVLAALRDFPMLNAEVRGTDIVYKKHYDIGIAVGSGRGLVVPVIRNADRMGFAEIEKAIAALATKAKDNKLTLDDLAGGTFTITNGGIYGSMMSTPLLNLPQTGILGMHNIVKRAVVISDKSGDRIEIRPMMYLALSYDHRLVDGREAVQCLVGVKERIEHPERMLFSL